MYPFSSHPRSLAPPERHRQRPHEPAVCPHCPHLETPGDPVHLFVESSLHFGLEGVGKSAMMIPRRDDQGTKFHCGAQRSQNSLSSNINCLKKYFDLFVESSLHFGLEGVGKCHDGSTRREYHGMKFHCEQKIKTIPKGKRFPTFQKSCIVNLATLS